MERTTKLARPVRPANAGRFGVDEGDLLTAFAPADEADEDDF